MCVGEETGYILPQRAHSSPNQVPAHLSQYGLGEEIPSHMEVMGSLIHDTIFTRIEVLHNNTDTS